MIYNQCFSGPKYRFWGFFQFRFLLWKYMQNTNTFDSMQLYIYKYIFRKLVKQNVFLNFSNQLRKFPLYSLVASSSMS